MARLIPVTNETLCAGRYSLLVDGGVCADREHCRRWQAFWQRAEAGQAFVDIALVSILRPGPWEPCAYQEPTT